MMAPANWIQVSQRCGSMVPGGVGAVTVNPWSPPKKAVYLSAILGSARARISVIPAR